MLGRRSGEIRGLYNKTLGDMTAFAQAVKDNEVANEVAVGSRFKHKKNERMRARRAEIRDRSRSLLAKARRDRCRSRMAFLGGRRARKAPRGQAELTLVQLRSAEATARR